MTVDWIVITVGVVGFALALGFIVAMGVTDIVESDFSAKFIKVSPQGEGRAKLESD